MSKLRELRYKLSKANIEGVLITYGIDVNYISGFQGEANVAMLLITQQDAKFITDGRFVEQAKQEVNDFEIILWKKDKLNYTCDLMNKLKLKNIGIDLERLTYLEANIFLDNLDSKIINTGSIVEELRAIKTIEELEKLERAASISCEVFEEVLQFIKLGLSELEVAAFITAEIMKRNATCIIQEIIVASGDRGSLPHGVATTKLIQDHDMVTLDYGAIYQGYRSDMTRTIAINTPTEALKKVYDIVYLAHQKAATALKPGVAARDIDHIARSYLQDAGYTLDHGLGHGIGLEVHEKPILNQYSEDVLKEHMVVTIEPGIYIPGVGGVRIEDDYIITKEGYKRITSSSQELIILNV